MWKVRPAQLALRPEPPDRPTLRRNPPPRLGARGSRRQWKDRRGVDEISSQFARQSSSRVQPSVPNTAEFQTGFARNRAEFKEPAAPVVLTDSRVTTIRRCATAHRRPRGGQRRPMGLGAGDAVARDPAWFKGRDGGRRGRCGVPALRPGAEEWPHPAIWRPVGFQSAASRN
jgi:hypothetical protein